MVLILLEGIKGKVMKEVLLLVLIGNVVFVFIFGNLEEGDIVGVVVDFVLNLLWVCLYVILEG